MTQQEIEQEARMYANREGIKGYLIHADLEKAFVAGVELIEKQNREDYLRAFCSVCETNFSSCQNGYSTKCHKVDNFLKAYVR